MPSTRLSKSSDRTGPQFSIEELLRSLGELPGGEGATVEELAETKGRSREWVRRRLQQLNKDGLLEVSFRNAKDVVGRTIHTPVYRLKNLTAR